MGAKTFSGSKDTLNLVNQCRREGKWLALICAATTVLADALEGPDNQLRKTKVTSHPSVKDSILSKGWNYSEDRVVIDDKVITSRG